LKEIENILEGLRFLANKGPIESDYSGSNAVGKVLQKELGIQHSTSQKNKYKDFVITSTSTNQRSVRNNLFASVPDWKKSKVKSSTEMLKIHGNDSKLNCTVDALNFNTFSLKLEVYNNTLHEVYFNEKLKTSERILVWNSNKINIKINELNKYAVLSAEKLKLDNKTYFKFTNVDFYLFPNIDNFFSFIDKGLITVDHLISIKKNKTKAMEKGPLFKIKGNNRDVLFEKHFRYSLI